MLYAAKPCCDPNMGNMRSFDLRSVCYNTLTNQPPCRMPQDAIIKAADIDGRLSDAAVATATFGLAKDVEDKAIFANLPSLPMPDLGTIRVA